jgi:two-component system response regulator GlrR
MRRGATSVSEALDGEAPGSGLGELPLNFQAAKDAFEHHYIAYLLRATHGNVAEAARVSGQYRPNVYRLIRRYHIDPQNFKYGRNEVIRATT